MADNSGVNRAMLQSWHGHHQWHGTVRADGLILAFARSGPRTDPVRPDESRSGLDFRLPRMHTARACLQLLQQSRVR
jgi:cation transport regulator ChaC